LPTSAGAARLNKIITVTHNPSLKHKIVAIMNKRDTMILADNPSTAQNNVIDCRNVAHSGLLTRYCAANP
jgi:hypothetical protein